MADLVRDIKLKLEKHFKDSTELFPDFSTKRKVRVLPTGSAVLDTVSGIGGFPRGRVTEIYGPNSTGKTTIAITAAAAIQKSVEGRTLYLDYEHAFDAAYAHKLGLDLAENRFVFAQPEYFEQGAMILDSFLEEGLIDLAVIDSAAAMVPKTELEGSIEELGRIGHQAQLMSRMLGRVTKKLGRGRKAALLIINQTRTKIDIRNPRLTGETAAGGNALKFYTSLRLELAIVKKEGDESVRRAHKATDQLYSRNRMRVTCVKNKLAPPFRRGLFVIDYGLGINNVVSIAELAEEKLGVMSGAGFFKYDGDSAETTFSCRGREAFAEKLKNDPAIREEVEKRVLKVIEEEQASELGLKEIVVGEKAKELEGEVIQTESNHSTEVIPTESA